MSFAKMYSTKTQWAYSSEKSRYVCIAMESTCFTIHTYVQITTNSFTGCFTQNIKTIYNFPYYFISMIG